MKLTAPINTLIRILLFGHKPDDGLYEELAPKTITKQAFTDYCEILRQAVTSKIDTGKVYTAGKNKGKPVMVAMKTRALIAPIFGESKVGKSTLAARDALLALRRDGVFPLPTPGLMSSDQASAMETATRFVRSFVDADRRTREQYKEQEKLVIQLQKEAETDDSEKKTKELEKAQRRLERMRPEAELRLFQPDVPISLFLGSNFVRYELEESGPRMQLTAKGSGILAGEFKVSFGAGNGHNILRHLRLAKQDEGGCTYEVSYLENGKRPRKMLLKEPQIHYKDAKGTGPGIYLHMPLMCEEESTMFAGANPAFQRQWPKPVEGLNAVRNLRALGVDLNVNPAAAVAVMEAPAYSEGLPTAVRLLESERIDLLTATGSDYYSLCWRLRRLKSLMNRTKRAKKDGLQEDGTYKTLQEEHVRPVFADTEAYIEHVKQLPEDQLMWTHPDVWMVGSKLRELRKEFNKRKHARFTRTCSLADEIAWCDLVFNIISVQKAFSFTGATEPAKEGYCRKLRKTLFNSRQDTRRKLCRRIVDKALASGCKVIAMERLIREEEGPFGRKDNRLWDLWSPRMLLQDLTDMARMDGIGVVQVSHAHTSQVVWETQTFGYRDAQNKHDLYYRKEDAVRVVNSDLNAACNIAARALDRHSNPYVLDVHCVAAGKYMSGKEWREREKVRKLQEKEEDPDKRKRIRPNQDLLRRAKGLFQRLITKQELERFDMEPGEGLTLYRNGTSWVTKEERAQHREDLKQGLSASAEVKPA